MGVGGVGGLLGSHKLTDIAASEPEGSKEGRISHQKKTAKQIDYWIF